MAKTIVGLDIGHWSIKVASLDLRDHSILGFEEHLHATSHEMLYPSSAPHPAPDEEPEEGHASHEGEEGEESFAVEEERPDWVQTLSTLSTSQVILDADVICCNVPPTYVTFLQIPVPFEEEDKVATILPSLLDSRLTSDLSSFFWSFYVEKSTDEGGDDDQPFQARVAVIEKGNLKKFLSLLRSTGVEPNYVVFGPLAATEFLQFQGLLATFGKDDLNPKSTSDLSENALAFLNLGHSTATLTVIDQRQVVNGGGVMSVATARTTMLGILRLSESIASELDLPVDEVIRYLHQFQGFYIPSGGDELPSEAEFHALEHRRRFVSAFQKSLRPLVRDIRRALQGLYARSGLHVETIYLSGGGAKITGLAEELSSQLGTGVALFATTKISPQLASSRQNILSWGLAGAAAEPVVRRKACNLRRAEFLFRGRSSYLRRQLIFGVFAILIVLGLIFGLLFVKKKAIIAQRDAMRAQLTTQTKELFGFPIYQKKKIRTLLEGKGDGAEKGLIPTRSAFELAYEIVSHIPSDVDLNISKFEVDTRRSIVQLRGDTTDAQAVDRIVSSLEGISCIKDIKKDRLTLRGERADFELQINTEGCS